MSTARGSKSKNGDGGSLYGVSQWPPVKSSCWFQAASLAAPRVSQCGSGSCRLAVAVPLPGRRGGGAVMCGCCGLARLSFTVQLQTKSVVLNRASLVQVETR
jgi:hypothetical protein